jgi:hypothetical protein
MDNTKQVAAARRLVGLLCDVPDTVSDDVLGLLRGAFPTVCRHPACRAVRRAVREELRQRPDTTRETGHTLLGLGAMWLENMEYTIDTIRQKRGE